MFALKQGQMLYIHIGNAVINIERINLRIKSIFELQKKQILLFLEMQLFHTSVYLIQIKVKSFLLKKQG